MRPILLLLVLFFSLTSLTAQSLPDWQRVYTFDESIIDMNTRLVTFISEDVSRVRFRWTFDQPESLRGTEAKHKSRLEVMELNCSQNRARTYHITFFDAAENIVRLNDSPGEWRAVVSGSMIEKLFVPGCQLVKKKTRAEVIDRDELELEKARKYAYSFTQHLEQTKDFKPIIDKFFVANYLNGYLEETDTNWFLNVNREIATKVSRKELQRFYIALMNTGYLSSLYVISQSPSDSDEHVSVEKLIPPDILKLIRNHRYTAAYKSKEDNYDFLAEKIDNVERLQSYTDLLERIASLMRKHVIKVAAEHSNEYRSMLDDWSLYQPRVRICTASCLGLPNRTRLFEVNVPVFRLQLAEIRGNLRVVSATSSF